jgi:hypothetical protein
VLAKALLQSGYARDEEVIPALIARHRVPRINLKTTKIPLETIELLKEDLAKRLRFLPLDEIGDVLVAVTPDIFNQDAILELRKATGRRLALIQCAEEGFDSTVTSYYQKLAEARPSAPAPAAPAAPPPPTAGKTTVMQAMGERGETARIAAPAPAGPASTSPLRAVVPPPSAPTPAAMSSGAATASTVTFPPAPAPAAAPSGNGSRSGHDVAWIAGTGGVTLAALAAEPADFTAARPLTGGHNYLDPRAEWDWTYASEGPVRAAEALL